MEALIFKSAFDVGLCNIFSVATSRYEDARASKPVRVDMDESEARY